MFYAKTGHEDIFHDAKKYVCPSFDDVLFVIRGLNIADSLIRDYI